MEYGQARSPLPKERPESSFSKALGEVESMKSESSSPSRVTDSLRLMLKMLAARRSKSTWSSSSIWKRSSSIRSARNERVQVCPSASRTSTRTRSVAAPPNGPRIPRHSTGHSQASFSTAVTVPERVTLCDGTACSSSWRHTAFREAQLLEQASACGRVHSPTATEPPVVPPVASVPPVVPPLPGSPPPTPLPPLPFPPLPFPPVPPAASSQLTPPT